MDKGDLDKALEYYERSLLIKEELGDNYGKGHKPAMTQSLKRIAIVHYRKGDYEKALDYFGRSLIIWEELGDKPPIAWACLKLGWTYYLMGEYEKSIEYYDRELSIRKDLNDNKNIRMIYNNYGLAYFQQEDYKKALNNLETSATMQMELDSTIILETISYLLLTKKILGKEYDEKEIHSLIKDTENVEFELNLRLYELLEDKAYLETAYNQVQEKADNLEPDVAAKFLSYPIPKAIVEEWEKVK